MNLTRTFFLLFLTAAFTGPVMAIDTYIVAGQSNGWRISHLKQAANAPADASEPTIHYFGMECVSEPDSSTLDTLTKLNEGTMGYGLAQALSDRAGEDIVFIQYCRCGASILNPAINGWWPGEDPANGKTFDDGLFGLFQTYIESARMQVKAELGEELEFKGLLWHQGESDQAADKAKFEQAVKNLFGRFRKELGRDLPIIAGHIRDLGEGPRGINATLDKIAAADPLTMTVPVADLEFAPDRDGKPDVHISLGGCHELGRRMVAALSGLELQAAVEKAGGTVEFADDNPVLPVAIDLYDGNNPLKGRGGRNELVNDAWLKNLAGLDSLKKLNLSNCAITNQGMHQVGKLTGLEELNLTLTAISDDGLKPLGNLTELRVLGLASSQCTGSGFAHLGQLKKLESVNFHFTPLDDDGLRAISEVGVNGRFWFAHVNFTDEGAKSLAAMRGLKTVGIGSKHPESSGAAVASLADLPIEDLSLLDNQATPEGLTHAARIASICRLDIAYAPSAGDTSLQQVAKMPKLEELRIGGSPEITDEGIFAFAETKSLKSLTLQKLKNVSEAGIAKLKAARPDLVIEVK